MKFKHTLSQLEQKSKLDERDGLAINWVQKIHKN